MPQAAAQSTDRPTWIDLSTTDPAAARDFYARVFGWDIQVNPDPAYGGYALAKIDGRDAAGIGGTMSPDQPAAWSVYIGTTDSDALAAKVTEAGGTVVAPPFPVGEQGRITVFRDPVGAFISAWEAEQMRGFQAQGANAFGWAELNARGVENAFPFYRSVFGWTANTMDSPGQPYTEFDLDGERVAGATEMNPMVPPGVPSYWLVYFSVDEVDATFRLAKDAGARELVAPIDFPGGRLAIVNDPQGAAFGLMTLGA